MPCLLAVSQVVLVSVWAQLKHAANDGAMIGETCRVPLIRREDAAPKALAIYEQSHREHGRLASLCRALANSPDLLDE